MVALPLRLVHTPPIYNISQREKKKQAHLTHTEMVIVKKDQNNHNHSHPMVLHRSKTSPLHGIIVFSFFFVFLLQLLPHANAQPTNDNSGGRYGYQTYSNPNLKPSMTVTIVVLVVACVFIAFISFYIRRCSHDMHMSGGSVRITRTRPAPRGLEASVIETFPTFLYSEVKGLKIGKGVLECAVCLNEFEDEETLRLLPKCDHVFHPECIDAWLSSHTTCPVCRAELVPHQPSEVPQAPESSVQPVENGENNDPGTSESQSHVSITVDDDPKPDVINPTQIAFPIQNRPARSKSMLRGIAGRFPRSHSTGHSQVQPGDNHERFTLKLPEEVRKKILSRKLNRTTSCITVPTQGSVRRNGSVRGNGQSGRLDRAAKSDRWGFLTATQFFWRNNSARLSKNAEGSTSAKSDGMGESSSTRPPV